MIGGVARHEVAAVARNVGRIVGRQRAETERSEKLRLDEIDHLAGRLALDQRERQAADREDLVRAEAGVDPAGLPVNVPERHGGRPSGFEGRAAKAARAARSGAGPAGRPARRRDKRGR